MFYVLQNESTAALRRVPILLTDAATGTTAQTGVGLSTIYPYVNINGGSFAGGAGTVAEAGYGQYYYEFDPSEIATLGLAGIHITASGCRDYDAIAQVAAFNVYSGAGVGITAGDVWSYDISGNTAEYLLNAAKIYSEDAKNQTGASSIRDAVWDTDVSYLYPSGQAGGALYAAAFGATDAGNQVWNYDISAITTAGTAGSQLNQAAAGGAGLTAGDVWSFDITGFGSTGSAAVYATNTNFTVGNIEVYVANQTPQDVWTYAGIEGRTITGGIADTVTSVINTVDISTQSVTDIWSEDVSGYSNPSAGYDLTQAASGGAGITAGDVTNAVWDVATSSYTTSGTFGHNILRSDIAGVAGTVSLWTGGAFSGVFADTYRIDEDYNAAIALKDILTGIGASITGNITGNLTGSVGYIVDDVTLSAGTQASIANSVWSTDISGYTSPSAGFDLANASSGAGITAGDVWNYTLLSSGQSADATLGNVDTNVTTIQGNTSNIPGDVWTYGTRTLTAGSGITAGDVSNAVWNVPTASYQTNGTFGLTVLRSDQQNKIGDVTLASSGGINRVDADMHAIQNNTAAATSLKNALTGVGASWTGNVVGNVTGSVASVTNPVSVTTTSMSGIANTVWTSVSKTITGGTVDNVTNPVAVSTTSMSGIAGTVWANPTKTITGGTVTDVTNPVSITTTSMSGIANTVWTYTPRTVTSGAGATAGDIWTYQIDTITTSGTAAAQLNDAAVSGSVVTIVNGPYRVTSTAEGTDGVIDILADSIQPITIYCINGFGQPFNIGGYTASVDIYDEAGGFVRSYTPTIDYALGGILTFNIDADITAVIGRYTLVVSLTDGDVIQLGPLTILVRPL